MMVVICGNEDYFLFLSHQYVDGDQSKFLNSINVQEILPKIKCISANIFNMNNIHSKKLNNIYLKFLISLKYNL